MYTQFFKRFALGLLAVFCLSAVKAGNIDFTGKWILNESKSDMGQFATIVPPDMEVAQKTDSVAITRTNKSFDGGSEYQVSETLMFNGKETDTATPPGNSKRKASAKWSEDGKTLTITYVLSMEFGTEPLEVKGTEVWTLADDGKTLNVTNSSSSSFGDNMYKAVYQKK